MTNVQSKTTTAVAISISQQLNLNTLLVSTAHLSKKRLVAQWLVDEKSQLYCKWVTKD